MKNALSRSFIQRAIIGYLVVMVLALIWSFFFSRTKWGDLPLETILLGPHVSFVIMLESGFDWIACLIDLAFFGWFAIALYKLGKVGIVLFGATWILYGFMLNVWINA